VILLSSTVTFQTQVATGRATKVLYGTHIYSDLWQYILQFSGFLSS